MDPAIGYAFALVFVLVGLAGMVLPALPGVPLVFAGLLLAAWSDGFVHVGGFTIVLLALLTLIAVLADIVASAFGTRIAGASGWAFGGAAVGAVVGLFFGIPGLILGPFLGALGAEWLVFQNFGRAAKAGGGAAIGLLIGAAVKVAVVFTMFGVFALAWWID
jgi:uncharacterized protein YqgC (DUF456 family)